MAGVSTATVSRSVTKQRRVPVCDGSSRLVASQIDVSLISVFVGKRTRRNAVTFDKATCSPVVMGIATEMMNRIQRSRMNLLLSKAWPKLVILEGIMGSGKTTNVLQLADRLNASGRSAIGITEGVSPHPIRFDWDLPWDEITAAQIAESAVARWKAYAEHTRDSETTSVVDGQLFHGNLTSLFLLEVDIDLIRDYVRDIATAIAPLSPLLIYLRHSDIDHAIRSVGTERGCAWVRYQIEWKLESPYAKRRGLKDLDGLIVLYREYRALTDQLYDELTLPKISIEDAQKDWQKCGAIIDRAVADKDAA
jgi:hypothetical protein